MTFHRCKVCQYIMLSGRIEIIPLERLPAPLACLDGGPCTPSGLSLASGRWRTVIQRSATNSSCGPDNWQEVSHGAR